MLETQLRNQLASVGRRLGKLWFFRRLTWCWIGCVALVLAWAACLPIYAVSFAWIPAAAIIAAIYLWISSVSLVQARNEIAMKVEQAFPELNSRLLAALEQHPDVKTGRFNVLQRQLISEAVHHSRINDWTDAIPAVQLRRAFLRQAAALAAFVVITCIVWPASAERSTSKPFSRAAQTAALDSEQPVIEPGDVELERGTSLLVLARFETLLPASVSLAWRADQGTESRISLTKSLDDPIFAGRLGTVDHDLQYRVDFDGRRTRDFKVTVYELPSLVRSDLELRFPSYTGLQTKRLDDAFVATVVEGTAVRITCRLNKPVASAKLVEADGTTVTLVQDATNPMIYVTDFVPTRPHRMKLKLIDDAGRTNRDPEEFRIEAKPNQPPRIELTFPGHDTKVSPLEEIQIQATVTDDFGLIQTGIIVSIPGREPINVRLGQNLSAGQTHKLSDIQRLEELKVDPDELVSYYVYADDHGPDGMSRRTSSDMYFAEVRSFEEVFRELETPGGKAEGAGSEQNQNPIDKIVELQKQIVAATWKLARSQESKFDGNVGKSIGVIQTSQKKAIELLAVLKEKLQNIPLLQSTLDAIGNGMDNAEKHLGQSISDSSLVPLKEALAAEQAAYQGLLKLRAKEHLIMKSQQSSGGSGGASSASKEQMEQLELSNKKNRYELQKSGQKQGEKSQQREELAVLDRLKELARRQQAVNDKTKELEADLRSAKSESEREELERQLKRLRDDQEQLLHDADEVRNRMAQSAVPERMNEARDQLEQTRQRMVDTAEKLREGQLSQAVNSGTRAERELQQIQEDFRKQTAARFADSMRTMRDEARQLAKQEEQLGEQLKALQDESKHSLRQSKTRQSLESEFKEQRRQANELVDQAKDIVEQSEQAEPLLAKQLYDTVRSTRESKTDQALDATAQLLRAGFLPEAQRAEEQAREGIERLKHGIEKAAEAVLGDELEALKRARAELAELSNTLEREIASEQAKSDKGSAGEGAKEKDPAEGQGQNQGQPGEGMTGQTPSGKSQTGQSQTGQGQAGQAQPGQDQKAEGERQGQGQGKAETGQGEPGKGEGEGEGQGQPGGEGNGKDGAAGKTGKPQRGGLRGQQAKSSQPNQGNPNAGSDQGGMGGGPGGQGGPLTGANFNDFNERLRDVESMVSDPKLQSDVAKIRERARTLRADFKRHSQSPNWDLVRTTVHGPMIELQRQLAEEIARRDSPESLVPVDRDPVPTRYQNLVRGYYERLGSGREGDKSNAKATEDKQK